MPDKKPQTDPITSGEDKVAAVEPEPQKADPAPKAEAKKAKADLPEWNVATHGPIAEENKKLYRVVGE